jgi:transposase
VIDVAQYYRIKQMYEREAMSQRQIAKELGISRNTVSKYLKAENPPTAIQRKEIYCNQKPSDEVQRVQPIIEAWLQEDQQVWKKQRHTAARIYQRLLDEYGFNGSASNIRKVVARLRTKVQEVFIPLEFQLGQQFQFDWGEADILLQGEQRRIHLFCIQLSASRKRFVRAYFHEKQEAFLDGFVHGFQYFGGVPSKGLFDNLKSAVVKVLEGRERLEQETFQALQAHYVFKAEFCNVRSGNEKGQVEGLVGYVRRNALVPTPQVQTLDELNDLLYAWCERVSENERVPHTNKTVNMVWEEEKVRLLPLPLKPFEACKLRESTVSKTSTVTFDTNHYSVPCTYAGKKVWIKGFVDRLIIVAQNQVIAEHPRSYDRHQMVLQLNHYLEAFLRKPRAVHDARVMQTAEIPDSVRRFHRLMHQRSGADGDRAFVRLLLLHRDVGMETLTTSLEEAERKGIFHYEGIHDLILRSTGQVPSTNPLSDEKVPIDLQSYRVQKANLQCYSALLSGGDV